MKSRWLGFGVYLSKFARLSSSGGIKLTVNDAVAKRISKLLREKDISQYRLEQESGIQHGSMQCIMNGRNKTVTLSTVILLARGFHMSLTEFLDDEIFCSEDLDVES
jgi:transcriptional regulator with XRE-family HTH domain